ncbi:hypothetical protein RHSIM_Rhsim13G0108200 [Rhododendron simsii]|uniref:DUF7803 domain-containing protein n=1 Tax=Rhododendron simsii TaxID=118357 RepID=A0A834L3H8_RHOSS|nr:hypothetical protein RHSIM_Rhsim13G0108200 [Rhododendron simsii]
MDGRLHRLRVAVLVLLSLYFKAIPLHLFGFGRLPISIINSFIDKWFELLPSGLPFFDSQPMMEETILVGDDLMMGPPSPLIPPEIASHVLEGVDLCDGVLRNFFLCLQINDIEPFCQDEIVVYKQCAEKRDKELRQRLQDSEHKLGLSMPFEEAKERAAQLESEVTSLDRRLILASGIEGMERFRQRWSLHGRLTDTK